MRLGPVCTVGTRPGFLLLLRLLVHWSSAPCPTACIWSSYRGFPPCCMRNISPSPAVVLTKTSPLGSHLPTRNTHDSHWASRWGEIKTPGFTSSGSVQTETRLGFPLIIWYLTDPLFFFARVCVCVLGGVNPEFSKLENHWHISGRSAAVAYINPLVAEQCSEASRDIFCECNSFMQNHCFFSWCLVCCFLL